MTPFWIKYFSLHRTYYNFQISNIVIHTKLLSYLRCLAVSRKAQSGLSCPCWFNELHFVIAERPALENEKHAKSLKYSWFNSFCPITSSSTIFLCTSKAFPLITSLSQKWAIKQPFKVTSYLVKNHRNYRKMHSFPNAQDLESQRIFTLAIIRITL